MLEVDDEDVGSDRNNFLSFVRLVSRKIEEESIFVGAWLSIEDDVSLVLDSTSGSENNNSFFIHSSNSKVILSKIQKFRGMDNTKLKQNVQNIWGRK